MTTLGIYCCRSCSYSTSDSAQISASVGDEDLPGAYFRLHGGLNAVEAQQAHIETHHRGLIRQLPIFVDSCAIRIKKPLDLVTLFVRQGETLFLGRQGAI